MQYDMNSSILFRVCDYHLRIDLIVVNVDMLFLNARQSMNYVTFLHVAAIV